jgi:hypothetical protein
MMKILFICLVSFLLAPTVATAQSKQKAEKEFLAHLNDILKDSDEQHWKYKGVMTIDSAFAINKEGILSVTVRYTDDTSFIRTRMEAPVKNIKWVAYDLYLILEYKKEEVTVYESEVNSNELKEISKTNYFHIGAPLPEDMKRQEKLQRLLDKVMPFYKN